MLVFHSSTGLIETPADISGDVLPPDVSWIDAINADASETAFIERTLKFKVPAYDRLIEIESTSRLSVENNHIFLSLPLVLRDADGMAYTTPIGFIVSADMLLTLHFEPLKAFNPHFVHHINANNSGAQAGVNHFLTIVECIIDHVADILEHVGKDLDDISSRIFSDNAVLHEPRREGDNLRAVLRKVGRSGDLTAKISDSLLGMGRMIPYVAANAQDLTPLARTRLDSLARDISSLNDYETHLTDKIQLLVDVTLGFTNVDQNNVFRVLTVFSIIGIPPTFFASMYGMNFKSMPEYDWAWGYPYGLTIIALSAIIPAVWFKWRGWW